MGGRGLKNIKEVTGEEDIGIVDYNKDDQLIEAVKIIGLRQPTTNRKKYGGKQQNRL